MKKVGKNLRSLWTAVEADLLRARNTLPAGAGTHRAVFEFQHYLEHNELELACDMLETYAKDCSVSQDFWFALRDAAAKMELPDRAGRYEEGEQG